jgi:hypothetical protein
MPLKAKVAAGLLGLAALAAAGDVESLHIANVAFEFKPGWTLQLHSRLRTNHNVSDFYQARGGTILQWQARPRVAALAGYYFIEQEDSSRKMFNLHRAWGGAQVKLWENARVSLEGRSLVERFFAGPGADFTRGRWRLGAMSKRRGVRPFASGEALRVQGLWLGRFSAGLQWTKKDGSLFAAGYEHRQYPSGPAGHILFTVVQWQAKSATREERR